MIRLSRIYLICNFMMKNIFRFLTLASMMLPLSSCMFEQEDFFSETSAIRMQHTNDDIQNLLCDQSADGKYGWVFQYFVAGTEDANFEGFPMLAKFDQNGTVTLASDHRFLRNGNAGKYTEHSSLYQMLAEEGPVISFNSWNNVMTVFCDPVDPSKAPSSIVQDGEGMKGDYNLVVTSFGKDEVTLRGERYSSRSRLIPCDRPWKEYLDALNKTKSLIYNDKVNALLLSNGVDSAYVLDLHTGLFSVNDRVDDPVHSEVNACVFTPDGFHMEKLQSLGANQYQNFVYDAKNLRFVCVEDEKVTITSFFTSAFDFFLRSAKQGVTWSVDTEAESSSVDAIKNLVSNFNKGTGMNFKKLSIEVADSTATLSFGWSRPKKSNIEYYKYNYMYQQTENGFTLSAPTAANTTSNSNINKTGIKEVLGLFTDSFVVSDDAPTMTRRKITLSKSSDSSVYLHMIY